MATAIGAYATTALVKARLFAAGVTDTADDTLIGTIVDQVNQYIEGPEGAGRVLAPISSATYFFDGDGSDLPLVVPNGVRAISLLRYALTSQPSSGGSYTTLAATEYFLRPLSQDRMTGWPATRICLNDIGSVLRGWPYGFNTVEVTMTCGWAAIPDDIIDVALTMAVRAWHARQNGQADIVGNDDTGAPIVSRFVSARDRGTLRAYRPLVSAR